MLPIKELLSMLTLSKRDIRTVIIFAIAIGLLSLVVPIAAQGLVTIVSFGTLRQPLAILSGVVLVLLIFSAISRVLQNILVETIQQRIFASIALKLAKRLPRIDIATLDENHGSELLNKFFDVMTLQKTTADILVKVSAFVLQAFLGMLLLASYHPALLAFDVAFVLIMVLIIVMPYSNGMKTALQESNAKYEVVEWLEEIARVPLMFHFQKNAEFGFERADEMVVSYLKARQAHFRVLLQHMIGAYGLQALASTSLFVIGGLLVLNNQMTLGQLVAAEIVTTTLGANAAKIARYLEKIYDLRAAAEKVNTLFVIPTENTSVLSHPLTSHIGPFTSPPLVKIKNLVLSEDQDNNTKLSFTVKAGTSLATTLGNQISRNLLADVVLGLRSAAAGDIQFNEIPLNNYPLVELREKISLIRHAECFDGTILENITISNPHAQIEDIMKLLNSFSLGEFISSLSQGLRFPLIGACRPFTSAQLMKLVFVREILSQPFFMVVDEAFDFFTLEEVKKILKIINDNCNQLTLLVTTRRVEVANLFQNRVEL